MSLALCERLNATVGKAFSIYALMLAARKPLLMLAIMTLLASLLASLLVSVYNGIAGLADNP